MTQKSQPGGNILIGKLMRNWLHQGITYMDTGELTVRLIIESLELIIVYFIISTFLTPNYSLIANIILSGIVVHTFNWIFNMNFYALLMFSIPFLKNRGEDITIDYLNTMAARLKRSKSVSGLAIFGSISRNQWHEKSDIDARILRKPGLKNLLGSAIAVMEERFLAFFLRQPLDIYLADNTGFLKKMRKDEVPIFLIKRDRRLEDNYPNNPENEFIQLNRNYSKII